MRVVYNRKLNFSDSKIKQTTILWNCNFYAIPILYFGFGFYKVVHKLIIVDTWNVMQNSS